MRRSPAITTIASPKSACAWPGGWQSGTYASFVRRKQAGFVRDRREGRKSHYSAQPGALAPLIDWTHHMAGFWESRFDNLEDLLTGAHPEMLSVVVERELPYPPEQIWRALTLPHLIEEWLLMKNDFKPQPDHRFNLNADWGAVECEVEEIELHRTLTYAWNTKDLESVITWTLTPTRAGTLLRFSAGSAAVLPGRHGRLGAVPGKPGEGPCADG